MKNEHKIDKEFERIIEAGLPQDWSVDEDKLYEEYRERQMEKEAVGVQSPSEPLLTMFKIVNDIYYLDDKDMVFRNYDNPEDTIEYEKGMEEAYFQKLTKQLNGMRNVMSSDGNVEFEGGESGKDKEDGCRFKASGNVSEKEVEEAFSERIP